MQQTTTSKKPRLRATIQEMDMWLDDIRSGMADARRPVAYHALRGVLTAIRDGLPVRQAYALAERLPVLVRTLYFHGYRPLERPVQYGRSGFLARVRAELRTGGGSDAELATRAVTQVMERRIGAPTLNALWQQLPADVQTLLQEPLAHS